MPLFYIGYIDQYAQQIIFTISLLGTASVPEEATRIVTGGGAYAGWRFNTDGTTDRRQGSYALGYDDWATPTGHTPGPQYEIRATRQSGSETVLYAGNLNTWEALSSNIVYELYNNLQNGTTQDIVLKIEIRDTATQTVQDTGYYKISVTSNAGGTTTPPTTSTTLPPSTL